MQLQLPILAYAIIITTSQAEHIYITFPSAYDLFGYLRQTEYIRHNPTEKELDDYVNFLNELGAPWHLKFTGWGSYAEGKTAAAQYILKKIATPKTNHKKPVEYWLRYNTLAVQQLQKSIQAIETKQDPRNRKIIQDAIKALERMTTEITHYHADEEALKNLLKSGLLASSIP